MPTPEAVVLIHSHSTMSEVNELDQLMKKIYNDPSIPELPMDLHSACALGNYECVQEAIAEQSDLNVRNKGRYCHVIACGGVLFVV